MKGFIVGFTTCLIVLGLYFTGGNFGAYADMRKAQAEQVEAQGYADTIQRVMNAR